MLSENPCVLGFVEWEPPTFRSASRYSETLHIGNDLRAQIARTLPSTSCDCGAVIETEG